MIQVSFRVPNNLLVHIKDNGSLTTDGVEFNTAKVRDKLSFVIGFIAHFESSDVKKVIKVESMLKKSGIDYVTRTIKG
ncbi:hypothetical protein LAh6_159 [Aeromonas phage LAh_6]|uniref:Uncharacterized protein n=1 Tax=Aeromonas phage LAh_6 TaxID=2591030 RepID=A0A513ZZY8_9CAUD|nr:hypothetical protein HWC30_gp159 [Aeromonas phage LAh_6]QDH46589.1 hypothetical protein LAh6_159 [Aeromonas phage LAh_6]